MHTMMNNTTIYKNILFTLKCAQGDDNVSEQKKMKCNSLIIISLHAQSDDKHQWITYESNYINLIYISIHAQSEDNNNK